MNRKTLRRKGKGSRPTKIFSVRKVNAAWIQRKRQEFYALKNALARFEWGCAYLPDGCHTELWHVRQAVDRMEKPLEIWEPTLGPEIAKFKFEK